MTPLDRGTTMVPQPASSDPHSRGLIVSEPSEAPPVVTCFLLKVASRCNLACDYCYVYEHADQSYRQQPKLMSVRTAQAVGRRLNEYLCRNEHIEKVTIVIHGGEPLLLGVKRMDALLRALLAEMRENVTRVSLSVQTNGVLLTRQWLDLFLRHDVTISLSADGPRAANDLHRLDHFNRSTYDLVQQSINALTQSSIYAKLFGGVLAVVDLNTKPEEVLAWAKALHIPSIDFLLPDGTYDHLPPRLLEPGIRNNAAAYGRWLGSAFDYWYSSDSDIRVRLFENIMDLSLGGESRTEGIGLGHFSILTIETDGQIQDTDVMKVAAPGAPVLDKKWSVHTISIDSALASQAAKSRAALARSLPTTCKRCSQVNTCGGGHLPHRYSSYDQGFSNPSIYCGDLSYLIHHIERRIFSDLPSV